MKNSKILYDIFIADIDDCDPNTCMNNGTCTDGVDDFTCDCLPGFTGKNCEMSKLEPLQDATIWS